MRYSDFIKPQNRKVLALQERADKQAGSPSVKPVLSGNAGVGVGAVFPTKTAPDTDAHANAGAGLGICLSNPAYLAGLLPDDFPIDQWEQLNTKQQLNAMKYSGLTPQEQWVLLNTNIPLVELRSSSSASSGSIARIVNPNANVPRDRLAAGNAGNGLLYPSNTPNSAPLHNADLIGKLKDKAASPATPSPASTPLPKPGPYAPAYTPAPVSEPKRYSAPKAMLFPPGVKPSIDEYSWYSTYNEAAKAWAKDNVGLSKDRERCALIYKNVDEFGDVRYALSDTYAGMKAIPALSIRDNVALQFIWLRYLDKRIPDSSIVGFIHTHPEPPAGMSYLKPSEEDLSLKKLGVDIVTVVPYETGDPSDY